MPETNKQTNVNKYPTNKCQKKIHAENELISKQTNKQISKPAEIQTNKKSKQTYEKANMSIDIRVDRIP